MEAMSPQQETLGGQPGRSSSLTGMSWIAGGPGTKKKMKTLAERRRSAPSLILDKALQKRPSTKDSPSTSMDTGAFLSSSICSNRTLLIDGRVELKRGLQKQERHLFLFSDLFVVAKSKYNNNFKIKYKVKLSDMWTASCVDEVGEGNTDPMKSFVMGWPTVNFVATFSSPELKDKWLSLLQRYITLEKEKDYPKSIPLKIFAKDIGNCAYSKTITITNSDTAIEVINMSLQMLGITGSDRDYQLWVNSGKEEAPYPLIGHEYPYGIKMSHLRDTALLTQEAKDSANPSSLQEPFLMEQLPREMQCQFTLKPSRLAAAQQLSDSGQKTFKRRRSIINWAFWRGSGTQLDNSPISPTSPMTKQLFGVSLTDICENDNLPKPILDILFYLNQKGPITKGIFRHPGNAKLCKELREKLETGADVPLDCEHIFVITSVLKDFLRHVPRSIFLTDLYDNWVCVMDQGNDEEKINMIQRLLDQLPRANIVLLKYLFGVLHNIEQQASDNQMNAYNLAVCIAPSILWSATSCSPELETVYAKKNTLLFQFLIENCCRIFGEEITSLFGEESVPCDIRENTSDTPCLQMTDSSYDSLENELNEDADAPCSDLVPALGQGSRSMDSVLTLSDYDPDQPELEGLLTLIDFDLDHPKHEDIQMEGPLDATPTAVAALGGEATLQDHAGAPPGTTTPGCVSVATEDAPKSPPRPRRCSEPSMDHRDAKLSSFRECNQKKLRKSSCDAILSQKGEEHLKQKEPPEEEGKTESKQAVVTGTDHKKNASNKNAKKKGFFGHEASHGNLPPPSEPVAISVASCSYMPSQDCPRSQPSAADTPGLAQPPAAEAPKSSRRQRCCSEPSVLDQPSKLSYLRGIFSRKLNKASYEVGPSLGEEVYLQQHKSLQMEGQKLINQSLIMGIEVGKSGAKSQSTEKPVPSRLNLCPRTSCSSLSSPGTSPSGSSVSSQDSAFSQISEHSVFTPAETSSPVDCTFQAHSQGEPSDLGSSSLVSGVSGPASEQASSSLTYTKKDTVERHSHMHSVTLHPSTWLRNGMASLKNWSLKNKARAARPEEKKTASRPGPAEPPPHASGDPEANPQQETQKDTPPRAPAELAAVPAAQPHSDDDPSHGSEPRGSSPSGQAEGTLELCVKSQEEGESSGQCPPGTPPCERPSPSSPVMDDESSPDSGPTAVCDAADKHSTKDVLPQEGPDV
ncbi:rho GTPase-activating protein 20 isoform X1 [Pipistrellus kuhlii]|uniref:Rho GTPase-activating protein 20 n=1 Tax=Pipistrellus kuhlii TaxID=59472 RepID=A0A7J7WYJ3_PIPKU|nr:rho GTPase-activating protein 20 isoform X1 [Pipistrellus kuhlii]KAF6342493.1 Rho GTPase activating protein 20 [Pipistrellus kuhlii]